MCNLYSITTNQAAIIALFRVVNRDVGNLAPMPGVFSGLQVAEVPFNSFSEFNKAEVGDIWFALDESRPRHLGRP